jgi:hypothetical protein
VKYVVTWENRDSAATIEDGKRSLAVFSKWTPAASNILQMVSRVDGAGGYSIVETDNPLDLMRDITKFQQWFVFTLHPVVDIQDAVPVFNEAIDFVESVP